MIHKTLNSFLLRDLLKIYIFTHSDHYSFSHVDWVVRNVGELLFQLLAPPGIFPESINADLPVYNYGNSEEIVDLIKSGTFKRKNIYNLPSNLVNANDKVKFHKKMEGCSFVPKTVFTAEEAGKLTFPIIAKPKEGSKGQGITVFKDKAELEAYDGEALDTYSKKFDLQREFRIISMKGDLLYLAERIPTNKKAKSLRESEDVFMRDGTIGERSEYVWKEREFGKGGLPSLKKFKNICTKTHELLKLDVLGIDIGIDDKGKLWLIEANTCAGLNNDQIIRIYLSIFKDFYGRDPEPYSMQKIKELQKELQIRNKDDIRFSFSARPGRMMDWGTPDQTSSVKFDIEKSFGKPLKDIKDNQD